MGSLISNLFNWWNQNGRESSSQELAYMDEANYFAGDYSAPSSSFTVMPVIYGTSDSYDPQQPSTYFTNTRTAHLERRLFINLSNCLSCYKSEPSSSMDAFSTQFQDPSEVSELFKYSHTRACSRQQTIRKRSLESRDMNSRLFHLHDAVEDQSSSYNNNEGSFVRQPDQTEKPRRLLRLSTTSSFCLEPQDLSEDWEFLENDGAEGSFLYEPISTKQLPLCETLYKDTIYSKSQNWVTIFGFPVGSFELALKVCSSDGEIREVRHPKHHPYNYIHVRFGSRIQTTKILRKQWVKIAPGMIVGVTECTEPAVVEEDL